MATTPSFASRIATFKLPGDEYAQVEQIAKRDDRSMSAVFRLAVRDYLERQRDEAAAQR